MRKATFFHPVRIMNAIVRLIIGLCMCLFFIAGLHPPVAAQEPVEEPLINLAAANQPLAEVLDLITAETGYQFNLSSEWQNHRVSATLNGIPLERGLKRLLRSLNYSIIWESDRIVTITVYGKAEPGRDSGAISFASPPQEAVEAPEPVNEPESDSRDLPETGRDSPQASDGEAEVKSSATGAQDDTESSVEADRPDEATAETN